MTISSPATTPFDTAEEAWFWFIQATQAREDGVRFTANDGRMVRPCEPADIMKILTRLHRHRRLDMNHFRVLRHYGVRLMAPDPWRPNEALSSRIWKDALSVLGDVLVAKGIVRPSFSAEIVNFQERRRERCLAAAW